MNRRSRAKLMPRAIAAGQRFARRAEKLPYFQSATDAYMRGWMAGYRAHRHDVELPAGYTTILSTSYLDSGTGLCKNCNSPAHYHTPGTLACPRDWTKFGPTQYVD